MSTELTRKFSDLQRGVYFIGTTPPKSDTPQDQMEGIAQKLLDRLDEIE